MKRAAFWHGIWNIGATFLFHMSNAQAQAEALERSVTLQIEKGGTTAAASADIDRKNTSG